MIQIAEQTIKDSSGLTFQFERRPNGQSAMLIFGESLPFGNREIVFDADGKEIGAGTTTRGLCKPGKIIRDIDELFNEDTNGKDK